MSIGWKIFYLCGVMSNGALIGHYSDCPSNFWFILGCFGVILNACVILYDKKSKTQDNGQAGENI